MEMMKWIMNWIQALSHSRKSASPGDTPANENVAPCELAGVYSRILIFNRIAMPNGINLVNNLNSIAIGMEYIYPFCH